MSHLCAQFIVLVVVAHRQDIVSCRVEAHSVVPVSATVLGPDTQHAPQQLGIARYQRAGTNPCEWACRVFP